MLCKEEILRGDSNGAEEIGMKKIIFLPLIQRVGSGDRKFKKLVHLGREGQ